MTEEHIFKYFRGEASDEEKEALDSWLAESEGNRERYRFARFVFEGIAMHSDPDTMAAGTARRGKVFRVLTVAVSGIAAAIAVFFGAIHLTDSRYEKRLSETMNTIAVPQGQRLDYTLADGTVIKLNSGAELQYPMAFAEDCREVYLDGEAYFSVEHDAQKPFIVKTFASDIRVLGTKFNVNADEAAGTFSATLVEGSIRLSNSLLPGEHIIMHPNEKVTLVKDHMILGEHDVRKDILWTEGILDISASDFTELMKKLEKAFGVAIVIDRETAPELDFIQGKFRVSDGIDCILKILQDTIDFTYTKDYRTGTVHIK